MPDLNYPIFSTLITALNSLRDAEKRPAEERRKFFGDHVEPVQRLMQEIHNDYTKSFSTAIKGLRKHESLNDVVDALRAERPIALAKRTDASTFLKQLLEERSHHNPIKGDESFKLFYSYVQAIDSYLSAASPLVQGQTWYSYFINRFSELVESGQDPFLYDKYAISGYENGAPDKACVLLQIAVSTQMPEAWSRLAETYAALKERFLRTD